MTVERKAHVGDVLICDASQENPYHGSLCGPPRVEALTALKHDRLPAELAAWFAPACGGARRITGADVDWSTSRVQ